MHKFATRDEAHEYVRGVLARHGIEFDPRALDLFCEGLETALDGGTFWLAESARRDVRQAERRAEKIRALQTVLDLYRGDERDRVTTDSGTYDSLAHMAMHDHHGEDLEAVLRTLDHLQAVESAIAAAMPDSRPSRNRPESSKGAGAAMMFQILTKHFVPWMACAIIAEMFTDLGIEKRPPKSVQRALYDKLHPESGNSR